MKVFVIGLGNLGTGVARKMDHLGHQVVALDVIEEKGRHLGSHFKGEFVIGSGMDQEILMNAGIRLCDSIVICTGSDEINAVIARVAKNVFHVPMVIARLYDARKAMIYRHLGIQVISSSNWGIERITELLTFSQFDAVYILGEGSLNLIRIEIPSGMSGEKVGTLNIVGEMQVVSITRRNHTFIPTLGTLLEPDDVLHISVTDAGIEKLKSMFGIT